MLTLALSIFDGPSGFPWMDDIATELFGPSPPMPNEEFNEAAVLDDALVAAGFTRPLATDVIERFRFADAGQVEADAQPRRPPAARPLRRPTAEALPRADRPEPRGPPTDGGRRRLRAGAAGAHDRGAAGPSR